MLVLSRKVGNRVVIGGNIEVTVVQIHGNRVRLGISAPSQVSIDRFEVLHESIVASETLQAPLEVSRTARPAPRRPLDV